MSHIQSSTRAINAGLLKWHAVTPGQARQFNEEGAPSPCQQAPDFLNELPPIDAEYTPKEAITKKLEALIINHSYREAFEGAINTVCQQQIQELDRVRTLSQFYYLIDAFATWIPELRVWEWHDGIYHERTDYLRITQFYYYFNQPQLRALLNPVEPGSGEFLTPLSLWLREFAMTYGTFLDTPESARYLESYQYGPEYAHDAYVGGETGRNIYHSFNDWFSRTFKRIDQQRPVAQPDNPRIIAFPAECTYVGQWAIHTSTRETGHSAASVLVKHVEWPMATLLKDSAYAEAFAGGTLVQCFLNVNDYHRQHAPAAGKILEARFIPGQVHLDVALDPINPEGPEGAAPSKATGPEMQLEAHDPLGFQFLQCRGLFVLETAIGKIAVLPVGMAQVSSIVFVKPGSDQLIRLSKEEQQNLSYDEQVRLINTRVQAEVVGKTVAKGDMMTSFLFGGSDLIMLFERQAQIEVTAKIGTHYPVRSAMAIANLEPLLL